MRGTERSAMTFAEAIQERVSLLVTHHDRLSRDGGRKRWVQISIHPQQITFPLARFEDWPDVVEGEVDSHTYRATPTVSEDHHTVTYALEVL